MKQDHPMTPNVLTSSQAAPYPTLDPVAYALFSTHGHIRIWSIKGTDMPRLALALNAPLTPLVKQADHEAAAKAAYEAGQRDASAAPDVAGLVEALEQFFEGSGIYPGANIERLMMAVSAAHQKREG